MKFVNREILFCFHVYLGVFQKSKSIRFLSFMWNEEFFNKSQKAKRFSQKDRNFYSLATVSFHFHHFLLMETRSVVLKENCFAFSECCIKDLIDVRRRPLISGRTGDIHQNVSKREISQHTSLSSSEHDKKNEKRGNSSVKKR